MIMSTFTRTRARAGIPTMTQCWHSVNMFMAELQTVMGLCAKNEKAVI